MEEVKLGMASSSRSSMDYDHHKGSVDNNNKVVMEPRAQVEAVALQVEDLTTKILSLLAISETLMKNKPKKFSDHWVLIQCAFE